MCTMYVVVTNIKSKSIVKSNQFYSADIDIAITQAFVLLNECALKKILPWGCASGAVAPWLFVHDRMDFEWKEYENINQASPNPS